MNMENIPETIIVEHCGNDHLEPIRPIWEFPIPGFPKPKSGGLWTSPVDSVNGWREWCENEDFNVCKLEKSFRLEISTKHLLVIESGYDFETKMVGTYMEIGSCGLTEIDWSSLVETYHGIWLTAKGELGTRLSFPYNLYGWDCETVLLFNEKPIIKVL